MPRGKQKAEAPVASTSSGKRKVEPSLEAVDIAGRRLHDWHAGAHRRTRHRRARTHRRRAWAPGPRAFVELAQGI